MNDDTWKDSYDAWKTTEPYDPENEPAPEVETIDCSECGHVVSVDGTETAPPPVKIGAWWYCASCSEVILCLDRLDDSDFDGSRE